MAFVLRGWVWSLFGVSEGGGAVLCGSVVGMGGSGPRLRRGEERNGVGVRTGAEERGTWRGRHRADVIWIWDCQEKFPMEDHPGQQISISQICR